MINKIKELFKKPAKSDDLVVVNDRDFYREKHQCPKCHEHIEDEELRNNLFVCVKCQYHFRITATERFSILFDKGLYENISIEPSYNNPIDFPKYSEKMLNAVKTSGEDEAISVAFGTITNYDIVAACMSFGFLGGSMGSLVGERVIQAIFFAIRQNCPCLLITASGGARMYEGLFSLMQMLRTSHAIALLQQKRLPLFVLLTDPTTGGVTASFAMLGNIILAEPDALIGFAGPRVIEGTLKQKLPEGFQRSEFQQKKGFVDAVVSRLNVRNVLSYLIAVHMAKGR